jgi:hypothetical protein
MQRFENLEPSAQRVDPNEAQAIVELWMARQHEAQAWPSVQDLAEALRTTPEEVRKLMTEVRMTQPQAPVVAQRRPTVPAGAWHIGIAIAGACALLAGIAFFAMALLGHPTEAATATTTPWPPPGNPVIVEKVRDMPPMPTTGGDIARVDTAPPPPNGTGPR